MEAAERVAAARIRLVAGLVCAVVATGCGGMRESRRQQARDPVTLGLAQPPAIEGAQVRSQDGTKLARRIGAKKSAEYAEKAATSAASTTASARAPSGATTAPVQVAQLPAPPLLPDDAALTAPAVTPQRQSESALAEPGQPAAIEPPSALDGPEQVAATNDLSEIRKLVDGARASLASMTTYQAQMIRQERVGATLQPQEEVVLSVRRDPLAVRLEWPNGSSKGREVLYSAAETGGKLKVNSPGSLVGPLSFEPNSPIVLKNSRHPITEAGLDNLLSTFESRVAKQEQGRGDGATMVYSGVVETPELGRPCHQIRETRANGEIWVIAIDQQSQIPVLLRGQSADGQLLELYVFRHVVPDPAELSTKGAFSPEVRWASSGGLLGRITR